MLLVKKRSILLTLVCIANICNCANILLITLGGTSSHKIPFLELAKGLIPRGHNVTFLSPFPPDVTIDGLEEITPAGLVFYVKNYTNWDLLGARMRGEEPVHPLDVLRYPYESCEALLSDIETKDLLDSGRHFDLIVLDGAFPECGVGFVYHFKAPFIYINTVGFYTGSLSLAGNPNSFAITPFVSTPYSDSMNLFQRTLNSLWHVACYSLHFLTMRLKLDPVLRRHFGNDIPTAYDLSKNVSFILQNGHFSVTYPRPYLPNVAEIACIHCHDAKPLPRDLEEFVSESGDAGFIYVSMGSSVKASNMPEYLRRMFVYVFKQLPQRVLWKWEGEEDMPDLSSNVKLAKWLPQQDILGHPKLKAFITHGGLLSLFETVYHGASILTLPVFCDHDTNAAKSVVDGYAIKLELSTLTADKLLWGIKTLIHNPKYRQEVKYRQYLLKDQKESPLEKAIYWTEYILKHKGAPHLQTPSRHLSVIQYYLLDVICLLLVCMISSYYILRYILKIIYKLLTSNISLSIFRKTIKLD